MRPQRLVGLIIILASLIPILSATYWYKTRIFVLVDQPISLAQGHITTPEFKSNLSGDYYIQIHLDRYEMGAPCQDYEILRTNWILNSNGRKQDSSANPARVWSAKRDGIIAGSSLGFLDLRTGTYKLELNVLSDSSCLNQFKPTLRIATFQEQVRDSYLAVLSIFSFILFWGALLVIKSYFPVEIPPAASLSVTGTDSFNAGTLVRYRKPRREPRKFSKIPSFGLIASWALLMVLIPVWIINAWLNFTRESQGVWVYVPQLHPQIQIPTDKNFPVLRLEGKGNEITFFVNSKPVTNHEVRNVLNSALQSHKARFVYLSVDPELQYGDAAKGIDIIRSVKAEVILYTPKMGGPDFAQPTGLSSRSPQPVK